jgi:hypothetical protein
MTDDPFAIPGLGFGLSQWPSASNELGPPDQRNSRMAQPMQLNHLCSKQALV